MKSSLAFACPCHPTHADPGECPTLVRGQGAAPRTPLYAAPSPPQDALVGQRLGTFRVVRQLGRGGMGGVYLAEHALIQKRVAVKVLHSHLAEDAKLVSRFLAEARAASRIQHENVVTVFDLDTYEGRPYLVMEYLEGMDLGTFAREPLAPELAMELLAQVCDALGAAHAQGVIHRDLKPANVFVLPREDGGHRVKLLDFGIAKHLYASDETPTQSGVLLGTPEFMAPEQFGEGEGEVDARTDIYAAGVLGYRLLTGQRPFTGRTAAEILLAHLQTTPRPAHEFAPKVPPVLSRVLQRAMSRLPAERYTSAAELKAALLSAVNPGDKRSTAPAFQARVSLKDGEAPQRLGCDQVGRTGLFLRTETPPPLLTRVKLTLELPGGELPCTGQVVRHVTPDQAKAWRMVPGFGVELLQVTPGFQETFTRLLAGERTSAAPVRDNPEAEAVLRDFRGRAQGDHYMLLGVPLDAPRERVREAARLARQTLESLLSGVLSADQRVQVERQLERVSQALSILGHLERRVEYDAARRNLAGIVRCLTEGLTVSQMEEARQRFLARERGADSRSMVQLMSARLLEKSGQLALALAAYEQALQADPLHLEALHGYRTLQRRVRGPTGSPSGFWPTVRGS